MSDEAKKIETEIRPAVCLDGVGYCDEDCPQHDGKRCRVIGRRPGEICWPWAKRTADENARMRRVEVAAERIARLTVVVESHADCGNVALHAIKIAREALGQPNEQPSEGRS
jgi:hypothetical protein